MEMDRDDRSEWTIEWTIVNVCDGGLNVSWGTLPECQPSSTDFFVSVAWEMR